MLNKKRTRGSHRNAFTLFYQMGLLYFYTITNLHERIEIIWFLQLRQQGFNIGLNISRLSSVCIFWNYIINKTLSAQSEGIAQDN
jgi:hypothetical protein